MHADWFSSCTWSELYPAKSASRLRFLRILQFYWAAARLLRACLRRAELEWCLIVNNDNVLCSHTLDFALKNRRLSVGVLVEGLMNFQQITSRNRSRLGLAAKRILAPMAGLRFVRPVGHLSGAFHPSVRSVFTFRAKGLIAPQDRVVELGSTPVRISVRADPTAALVVLSGLWQWMTDAEYDSFKRSFVDWLASQHFSSIFVKRHPNVHSGGLEEMIPNAMLWGLDGSIEDLAGIIPAGTVIGSCCTALVTLPAVRPDLSYVDFGADVYVPRAYFGDDSVKRLLSDSGVQMVSALSRT